MEVGLDLDKVTLVAQVSGRLMRDFDHDLVDVGFLDRPGSRNFGWVATSKGTLSELRKDL